MFRLLPVSLIAVFLAPIISVIGEIRPATLPAKLTVRCLNKDKVQLSEGAILDVELTFECKEGKGVRVRRGEYRVILLDKDGRQLDRSVMFADPDQATTLRKGGGKDVFTINFLASDDVKAGEDYYLVLVVRDKAGMIKFKG